MHAYAPGRLTQEVTWLVAVCVHNMAFESLLATNNALGFLDIAGMQTGPSTWGADHHAAQVMRASAGVPAWQHPRPGTAPTTTAAVPSAVEQPSGGPATAAEDMHHDRLDAAATAYAAGAEAAGPQQGLHDVSSASLVSAQYMPMWPAMRPCKACPSTACCGLFTQVMPCYMIQCHQPVHASTAGD